MLLLVKDKMYTKQNKPPPFLKIYVEIYSNNFISILCIIKSVHSLKLQCVYSFSSNLHDLQTLELQNIISMHSYYCM